MTRPTVAAGHSCSCLGIRPEPLVLTFRLLIWSIHYTIPIFLASALEHTHHHSGNLYQIFWCRHYAGVVGNVEPDTWNDMKFSQCESYNHVYSWALRIFL